MIALTYDNAEKIERMCFNMLNKFVLILTNNDISEDKRIQTKKITDQEYRHHMEIFL